MLTGPTGTGKTDWASRLAESCPLEIVSVDSALVYRGLDIGTAKPSRGAARTRSAPPHRHLRAHGELLRRPVRRRRRAAIDEIQSRGRIPLLVGGTMLYLRALWRHRATADCIAGVA